MLTDLVLPKSVDTLQMFFQEDSQAERIEKVKIQSSILTIKARWHYKN